MNESQLDHSAEIDGGLLKTSTDTPRLLEPADQALDYRAAFVGSLVEHDWPAVAILSLLARNHVEPYDSAPGMDRLRIAR